MLELFRDGGFSMFVLAGLGLVMLWTSARFAFRATAQRLALIRALTIALCFATVTGFVANLAAVAKFVVVHEPADQLQAILHGFAEACAAPLFGFGLAAMTWILVAVGVRRMDVDTTS